VVSIVRHRRVDVGDGPENLNNDKDTREKIMLAFEREDALVNVIVDEPQGIAN
jgi:hypothetical protein